MFNATTMIVGDPSDLLLKNCGQIQASAQHDGGCGPHVLPIEDHGARREQHQGLGLQPHAKSRNHGPQQLKTSPHPGDQGRGTLNAIDSFTAHVQLAEHADRAEASDQVVHARRELGAQLARRERGVRDEGRGLPRSR